MEKSKANKEKITYHLRLIQPDSENNDESAGFSTAEQPSNSVLSQKLDLILHKFESMEKRLTKLESRMDKAENKSKSNQQAIKEIQKSLDFMGHTVDENASKHKSSNEAVSNIKFLQNKVEDLENRSRRNNIVFHNVQEGLEKEKNMTCEELIKFILTKHMKLEEGDEIEIERAHRSPTLSTHTRQGTRPIHCKLLRYTDRKFILRQAAKTLKNNPLGKNNIYISDDVSKNARMERRALKLNHLDKVRQRPDVQFAFIPFSLPPAIRYKTHDGRYKSFVPDK